MKKRKLNKKLIKPLKITGAVVGIIVVFTLLYLFVFNNIHFIGVRSIHDDAKTYKTKTCLAFYPNTKDGKQVVKDLCSKQGDNEAIFDYALIEYGDYYLVEYGDGVHYYIDHDNNPLKVETIKDEGKRIVSEYLRYNMKKAEIDEAYTSKFIDETDSSNLDISECTYEIQDQNLLMYFPKYDFVSSIPLKYIQKDAGINLGYENETYVKPTYVSKNRKVVALTFDDGPSTKNSKTIIDSLYKYDGNATFFVLGGRLENKSVELIKDSIEKGNQYGSHTESHPNLNALSAEEIEKEIMSPANDIYNGYHVGSEYDFDGLKYNMTVYRAPYGNHNAYVDEAAPLINITWDCDTKDWDLLDAESVINEIHRFEEKNTDELNECIILFHDIYESTAEAIEKLVPELIDKGYQLITVDQLLNRLNISKQTKASYPW